MSNRHIANVSLNEQSLKPHLVITDVVVIEWAFVFIKSQQLIFLNWSYFDVYRLVSVKWSNIFKQTSSKRQSTECTQSSGNVIT